MKARLSNLRQVSEKIEDEKNLYKEELDQERFLVEDARRRSSMLEKENAQLGAELKHLRSRFEEQINNREKDLERFEHLANKVLDDKAQRFDQQHKEGIKQILEPLQIRIKHFEQKIEHTNKESLSRHSSLKEQIKNLSALNEQMSTDAKNLTNALKSDTKKQGNWGELILESILDKSGLVKDREYFVQRGLRNDEGKLYKPDVIIALPDSKKLIIDSKVSLTAYESFVNAQDEKAGQAALKAHGLSIQKHIKELSAKQYHDLYQMDSPDFVLMFIPIDTAFSAALMHNDDLYQYAFDKNIVIVTPSTLLATLKTVETMWRNEKQNKHAIEIAVEAGKMYDKFVGFISDLDKLGNQLNVVQKSFNESLSKLHQGRGNLVSKAEKLKELGAKASKQVPEKFSK